MNSDYGCQFLPFLRYFRANPVMDRLELALHKVWSLWICCISYIWLFCALCFYEYEIWKLGWLCGSFQTFSAMKYGRVKIGEKIKPVIKQNSVWEDVLIPLRLPREMQEITFRKKTFKMRLGNVMWETVLYLSGQSFTCLGKGFHISWIMPLPVLNNIWLKHICWNLITAVNVSSVNSCPIW